MSINILPFPAFTRLIAHVPCPLQDVSKVDVGSLSLSSHTSVGRLDSVGRAVLLVSDFVLPPHLRSQPVPASQRGGATYVEPEETVTDGLEDITSHHTVGSSLVSRLLVVQSGHGAD